MKVGLLKLLSRVIGNKHIRFDGSRIFYWNVPMIALPFDFLVNLEHDLSKRYGERVHSIFYQIGKLQGENGTNILLKKFNITPKKEDLSFFAEQTEFVGIGKLSFYDLSTLPINAELKFSPNASVYNERFKKASAGVCNISRGLITGAIKALYNKTYVNNDDLDGIEKECVAMGSDTCTFEIRRKEDWQKTEKADNSFGYDDDALNDIREKENLTSLLRTPAKSQVDPNTELGGMIKKKSQGSLPFGFEGGVIRICDMPCLITPMDIYSIIYHELISQFGDDVKKRLYQNAKTLGKNLASHVDRGFNLSAQREPLKYLVGMFGCLGLGKLDIVRVGKGKKTLHFSLNDGPGNHYRHLFGVAKMQTDEMIAGMVSGMLAYNQGKEFMTQETDCVVAGTSSCSFKSEAI